MSVFARDLGIPSRSAVLSAVTNGLSILIACAITISINLCAMAYGLAQFVSRAVNHLARDARIFYHRVAVGEAPPLWLESLLQLRRVQWQKVPVQAKLERGTPRFEMA
jgi:hypothetical protein